MEDWQAASRALLSSQTAIGNARVELDEAMKLVVDGALGAFPNASGAVIEMLDHDTLVHRAGSGIVARSRGLRLGLGDSLSGRCIQTGEPQVCNDSATDIRVDADACARVGARSFAIAPLTFQGRAVGVLKIFAATPFAFAERELVVARLLARAVMFAFASAERADMIEAHDALARRFAATFDQAAVGIAHVSPDGKFLLVNERFCEIAGHDAADLLEDGFQHITHPDDLGADMENVAALIAGTIPRYSMEKRYLQRDGTQVWVNLTVSLVRDQGGSPDFFVAVIEDISARKQAEALAAYDSLTGLPNRRTVLDNLARQLIRMPQHDQPLAVAYLDIDRFKRVNDRFGHAEGDRCLVAIADALRASLRAGDLLGRMAGDEFVLILPDASEAATMALLRRLRSAVDRLPDSTVWDVSVSAGAIIVLPGMQAGPDEVLHAADQLMYQVKRSAADKPIVQRLDADPGEMRLTA